MVTRSQLLYLNVTTSNDIGQTVTNTVTVMSYDQVGDGVYTSAPGYSQAPVTTTTVSADTATATVVISHFPSIGVDGVTRTGTTTLSTVSVGGETGYTTSVDRGNGSIETDVISHITTTDSNGNPTTITTTITNAQSASNSKANVGSDYTTTVVSDGHTLTEIVSHSTGTDEHGHTIVSTVTETLGVQSHGNTVSSTVPVSTVSGAGSNASGAAGVGGIVNSQKPQSQNVADQGSGNEKPTQASAQPVVVALALALALALGQFTNRQAVMYHLDPHLFRVQRVLRLQSVVFIVAKHHTLYLPKPNNKDKDKHHHHVNSLPRLFYHLLVPLLTTSAVDSAARKQHLSYRVRVLRLESLLPVLYSPLLQ
ncbi:hypothetical protein J7296_02529 [Nakaseomyces glabratus]|nr:hypothetical protein J7296_02529 [Nakaseomyces glabratus]